MITQTELAKMRIKDSAPLSTEEILKKLIEDDMKSVEYQKALEGERYYSGEQDIKSHDFRTSYVQEKEVNPDTGEEREVDRQFTNRNRSNQRLQHRFAYVQIEQKVSYISGKEPSISVDGADPGEDGTTGNEEWTYQSLLTDTTDARFRKTLLELERQASQGGKAWLHEYKDREGNLRQIVIPRTGGFAIYDTAFNKDIVGFIRHYPITITVARQEKKARKAEWWTDHGVTYYVSDGDGKYSLDPDYKVNPAPHFWEVTLATGPDGVTLLESERTEKSWGRVPFIELANNSAGVTDVETIKDLVDAYDLVASAGTNNLMDFNEFWAVIQGFGGDTASAIVKKLKVNQAVSIGSQGGSVEMKQLDLQMQGRIDWLRELWDSIYYFGMAVDTTKESLGTNASGIALEFQYSLLDLKANNMIIEAEEALSQHFEFITDEINRQNGTNYDSSLVQVTFSKNRPTNEHERVQMIAQSAGLVPERVLLQAHPLVKDPDEAYKQILAERENAQSQQMLMFGNYATQDPLGD